MHETGDFNLNPAHNAQRIFRIYRLCVASVLMLTYFFSANIGLLEIRAPQIYFTTNLIWLPLVIISSMSRLFSRQDYVAITLLNILIDLLALSIIAYACGGINSGLLLLLMPEAAMAGLMLPMRLALLSAAVASLSTLFMQLLLVLEDVAGASIFLPSGIFGIVLFVTTFAFSILGQRLSAAELRARESAKAADSMRAMNESVIARMETGVLVVQDDRIILANRAAESLLTSGASSEETILGHNIRDLPRLGHRFETWTKNPEVGMQTFTQPTPGLDIQVQFRALGDTEVEQSLVFLEDTRRLRQRAQQLKLEALSRLSAGLAHEVRNPLSAISQANQLLQQSRHLSPEDVGFINIIDRHCGRMNEIINVVQQLSRRFEPTIRTIALKPFLDELSAELQEGLAEAAEIEINVDENCLVRFDPANLRQVLTNIIENGLRHSQEMAGVAHVTLSLGSHHSDRSQFLDIHDLGPGIPRDLVRLIFDPFFTTAAQGSGLGLYVARELCEVNFATVHYVYPEADSIKGFFRVNFSAAED